MTYDFENLINNLHDAVCIVDLDQKITIWNKAAEKLTGFLGAEVIGKRCMDNILNPVDENGKNLCQLACPLLPTLEGGQTSRATIYIHHKAGHRVPVSIRVTPIRDENQQIVGAAKMFIDDTGNQVLKKKVEELERLALLDPVTKLSNRSHINSELESRFHERNRYGNNFGVLFMGIDNLQRINEHHGSEVGDRILRMVADTLAATGRPYDVFGRWEENRFVGIIRNVDLAKLAIVGERCRIFVEKSYLELGEEFLNATISVGGSVSQPGDNFESIMSRVRDLLHQSKAKGENILTVA